MLIFGNHYGAAVRRLRPWHWMVVGCAVLAAPLVFSEVVSEPGARIAAADTKSRDGAAKAAAASSGSYQLRCWQYGQLMFEENYLAIPADSAAYALRMTDRNRAPVYLVQSGGATCLIKPSGDGTKGPLRP
jgi:hypothetical protein